MFIIPFRVAMSIGIFHFTLECYCQALIVLLSLNAILYVYFRKLFSIRKDASMKSKKDFFLSVLSPSSKFWLIFVGIYCLQLDALGPSLFMIFVKKAVPLMLFRVFQIVGGLFCLLFISLAMEKKKLIETYRKVPAYIVYGLLLYLFASVTFGAVYQSIGLNGFISALGNIRPSSLFLSGFLGCLIMFSVIWFMLLFFTELSESDSELLNGSSIIFMSTLKLYFRKILFNLPISVALCIFLSLSVKLCSLFSIVFTNNLNGDALALGMLTILQSLIISYVLCVFINVAKLLVDKEAGTDEKDENTDPSENSVVTKRTKTIQLPIPAFILLGMIGLMSALSLISGGTLKGAQKTFDNIVADIYQHNEYANFYAENSDYHNSYYETKIALSESKASQAYISALISKKNNSKYDEANELILEARDLCPNSSFVYFIMGRINLMNQNPSKAVENLETSITLPGASEIQYLTLLNAYTVADMKDKSSELIPILIKNNYLYDNYHDLSSASLKKLYEYKDVLEKQESELMAVYYYAKAMTQFECGEFEACLTTLKTWNTQYDSLDSNYWYSNIASQYSPEGRDYPDAVKAAMKFFELYKSENESDLEALTKYTAATLIDCNAFADCIRFLKDCSIKSDKIYGYYCYSLYMDKQYKKSLEMAQEMLSANENNPDAIYLLAISNLSLGEYAEANTQMEKLEKFLSTEDQKQKNYIDECLIKYSSAVTDIAGKNTESFLSKYPTGNIVSEYIYIYASKYYQNYEYCLEKIDHMLENDNTLYSPHYLKGLVKYEQGEYDAAEKNFADAIRLKEDSEEAYFHMAFACAEKTEYGKAIRYWNKVRSYLPVVNHSKDVYGYSIHSAREVSALKNYLGEVK